MPAFTTTLTAYLLKRYAMDQTNVSIMIEEEWDYIEERIHEGCTVHELSQELIEIYMAA